MHARTDSVQEDIARFGFHPTPYGRRVVVRRKRNEEPFRPERDIPDTRQAFPAAKQVQMAQFDPCQASLEIPTVCRDKLHSSAANIRLIIVGVEVDGRAA